MDTRAFRIALALAVAGLAAPAFAAEPDKKNKSDDGGRLVGSLAFHLGFVDELTVKGDTTGSADAAATLGITPAFEKQFGRVVAIGGEWMFVWAKAEDAANRRLIMSPHLRARMSFPVYRGATFDALLGVGPTVWTSDDDVPDEAGGATRFGWSVRFAFGGGYAFNDAVAAFFDMGYYTTTSYGDDLEVGLSSVLTSVGLRSGF